VAPGLCSAMVDPSWAGADDNCGTPAISSLRSDGALLSDPYPLGTTTITWSATDVNGISASCSQTITVVDDQPPKITSCAPARGVSADATCQAAIPDLTSQVAASDNCTPSVSLTRSQSPPAG